MELQLGKQKRMMYARVFDRTEEETCSVDAVVPDALGDIGAIVVAEGTFCLWNLDFRTRARRSRAASRPMWSTRRRAALCAASRWSCR